VNTVDGALRYRFSMKKSVAGRNHIPFTLTFDDFKKQYERQEGRDGYTGEQMCFDFGQGRSGATITMDRVDNNRGYIPGNVVFCRLDTNSKKGSKPVQRFAEQLKLDFPSLEVPSTPAKAS
jgi:hypothetical protein